MKPNFFTTSALNAGLESVSDKPVGPDAIHTQDTLQPKPGFKEDKDGAEDSLDDIKIAKEYGEGSDIADHDAIDTVAESQEHTLALEMLHESVRKFSQYCGALEEIAEVAGDQLEAGQPMDPTQVTMLTTALDASGVGEPLAEGVALESFGFDANVATEAFVDTLKERAGKVKAAIAKFVRKIVEETKIRLGHFSTAMNGFGKGALKDIKKNKGALQGFSGRNFDNAKAEKKIQSRIIAPSSAKTPVAALKEALAAFEAASNMIDTRMSSAVAQATRAWSTDSIDKVPAALNRVLETASELMSKHSTNSKYTTIKVEAETKKVTPENASKLAVDKMKRTSVSGSYDNSLKVASAAELEEAEAAILKAARIFNAKSTEALEFAFELIDIASRDNSKMHAASATARSMAYGHRTMHEGGLWDLFKIGSAYRYAMYTCTYIASSVEMGLAEGVYRNASACVAWAQASIAEAKKMAKAQN
jgi:hypothetical protein